VIVATWWQVRVTQMISSFGQKKAEHRYAPARVRHSAAILIFFRA
jgi:hypothetical protein